MKWELGAGSGIRHRIEIANFGGDIRLFLCVAHWMYLIHIQLGFLGLREIRRKESINKIGSLMCPCCCCDCRTTSETSALDGVVQPKRVCLAAYPISVARKGDPVNKISHPDWVKLCVELNCAPNQKSFCYSSAQLSLTPCFKIKFSSTQSTNRVCIFVFVNCSDFLLLGFKSTLYLLNCYLFIHVAYFAWYPAFRS